ncbi:efflux RND transporter permease subunit [Fulvivirgaceae bacterium PWU4]|uniref:Efflux RND transporter permease subunit n=1 Tax=Chryseosolibacter histidini TaxID=2782349 RepID=A0AAP2DPK6_9BACT|nr:efflux RND transporter permease subunit [Chryseosolibacter histidini]MBT1700136.1 efflux RND transporter permease subunit [Chryseosolibacter histidini]
MKKIVSLAVSYPVSILMMVLAVILLGSISFGKLGIELVPEMKNPTLFVELKVGIKPPSEVEKQFIESIESIAIRQSGAVEVSSVSQTGYGRVTVQYDWSKDMDEAFLDLQKSLSSFSLNDEVDEFVITQFDPNAAPVMTLGIYNPASNDTEALRRIAENNFRNEFIKLPGIAEVRLSGEQEKEVVLETDPDLLASFGLTVNDLVTKIQNYNRSVSGGFIEELGRKYVIKGLGIIEKPEDLEALVVGYTSRGNTVANPETPALTSTLAAPANTTSSSDQVPVLLREVATIKLLDKEASSIVRVNQRRSIGMSIYKETNYNTVNAVNELMTSLERLKKTVPGYEFVVIQNQGRFIQGAIDEVKESGLYGILFAVIVLFLFLRRIGSTLIISIVIPISIIATFNLMYFNGLTLNVMTLGGLALSAGMLVDIAIVVVENIFRKREEGMSVVDAAVEGTSEVSGAITASTLTCIVVFLPIVYLQGPSGELFKDQAWTVAFSQIASLFVALLVIPMLFAQFFRKDKVFAREKNVFSEEKQVRFKSYRTLLEKGLNHKTALIVASFAMIFGAALLVPVIGSEYMPQSDTRAISVDVTLTNGTPLPRTSATVSQIEGQLLQLFEGQLDKIYSHIGAQQSQSGITNENVYHENQATLKLIFREDIELDIAPVMSKLSTYFEALPGVEATFANDESALYSVMGDEEMPLVVELSGADFDKLRPLSDSVMHIMAANEYVFDPVSDLEEGVPQIKVDVDKYRAGLFNLSIDDVIVQIRDQLEGKPAGTIERGGEIQDIKIRVPGVTLAGLENMRIKSGQREFPLSEISTVHVEYASNAIHRKNQTRTVSIGARVNQDEPYDKVVKSVETALAKLTVPPQYKIKVAGQELRRQESVKNLTFALVLSIVLVYMVLASQFESLLHPFTILLTIPLAAVGAILAFFILGMPLNMMGYIGIILLGGIAVNNSIMIIDCINQNRQNGMALREAILDAGERRLRPIMMTSMTTILGILPLTLGFGESAALRAPIAIAVIGGLVTSTLLTLIIIPCYYESIENVIARISRKKEVKIEVSHG